MSRLDGRFAIGAVALTVAGPLASATNFVFHAIASRQLGPSGYGALSALLTITLVVAVPVGAVQTSLARSLLNHDLCPSRELQRWGRAALGVVALTVIAAWPISELFDLNDTAAVAVVGIYLGSAVLAVVPRAVLIAGEGLLTIAAAIMMTTAIRLGLGAMWLFGGSGLVGALAAGSIAELLVSTWLVWQTRSSYRGRLEASRLGWRNHTGPVLALAGLWLLITFDTALARLLFEPDTAGHYAASTMASRVVLFLPSSIAIAVFARMASPRYRLRALPWATAAVVTVAALAGSFLLLTQDVVAAILFGRSFHLDPVVLALGVSAMTTLAVANLWVHARIAGSQPAALRVMTCALLGIVAGLVIADSPRSLAAISLAASVAVTIAIRPSAIVAAPFPDPRAILPPTEDLPRPVEVSVIVPAYNEADKIVPFLSELIDDLAAAYSGSVSTYEVIVADDGSTDGTAEAVEAATLPGVTVLRLPRGGKGLALRRSFLHAKGSLIGFIDGDGDLPADTMGRLIELLADEEVDGAVAVKGADGRSRRRQLASRCFVLLQHIALAPPVEDTQTGAKLFRRSLVAQALPWMEEEGFAVDIELLALAKNFGFGSIATLPVAIKASDSTITVADVKDLASATTRVAGRLAQLPTRPSPFDLEPHTVRRPDPGRRLRILICNWKCQRHPAAGGAERFTHQVAKRWAADGHAVTLFAPTVEGAPDEEILDGVRVIRQGTRFSVYQQARHYWYANRSEFDIILDEANTRPFGAPLWADVPVVALFHQLARDVWWQETPKPVALLGRHMLEPSWLRPYRTVPVATVSESSARSLRSAGFGSVLTVGCGIALPPEVPTPDKGPEPTMAFLGRLCGSKRPLEAIEAFRLARERLGTGTLYIIGGGPLEEQVEARAAEVEGVIFAGRVDETTKFELLARCHALLVTSTREGWGLVVDEAAAVGALPVGYRVPGLIDSVPAAGGLLVSPEPEAMAEALVEHLPDLVASPKAPRTGGAEPWDTIADRLLAVLCTALSEGHEPSPILGRRPAGVERGRTTRP